MVLAVLEDERRSVVCQRQRIIELQHLDDPGADCAEARNGRSAGDVVVVALHRADVGGGRRRDVGSLVREPAGNYALDFPEVVVPAGADRRTASGLVAA